MKRRTMLQVMGGGLSLPLLAGAREKRKKTRNKGSVKKLLVIFQRGGNDGLNTLVPVTSTEYDRYRQLRPDVFIPATDLLDVNGTTFFGMHQALRDLRPMMNAGHLSFIHAVGYPSPNRSHFESQAYYETGLPGNGQAAGWLNNYLAQTTGSGLIRGISIASSIPQSMSGNVAVPVSRNFGNFEISVDGALDNTGETNYRNLVAQVFNATPTTGNDAVYNVGDRVFDMISGFADRDASNYTPENGATYPNTGFGDKMAHAAQMLKDEPSFLGIEVVTLDQGGYDTHAGQVVAGNTGGGNSRHSQLLAELGQGMAAFYTDLGNTRMQDVVVLVVSEFGRRAYQNDSLGTDHGTGALAMVMGTNVSGTAHNDGGRWPGLGEADLYHGDLDWVTDFRDIYWELLSRHMGVADVDLANILPGHTFNAVDVL